VETELGGGRLSEDVREKHHHLAIDLGLWAMNMPKELGGGGLSMFQQVLVSEQLGLDLVRDQLVLDEPTRALLDLAIGVGHRVGRHGRDSTR